jgi:LmbE family N-acetylglucosaminyl deacetylase
VEPARFNEDQFNANLDRQFEPRSRLSGKFFYSNQQTPSKKILAVFAHSDDDITIGPLLAHYAAQGVKVYHVVLTSEPDGVTAHAKIPAGAQLGAVREAESRAACKAYGIEEPFLFGEQDGSLASMQHHDHVIHRLGEIVTSRRPSSLLSGQTALRGTPTIGL